MPGRIRHSQDIGGGGQHGRGFKLLDLEYPCLGVQDPAENHFATQFFCRIVTGPESHKHVVTKGDKDAIGRTVRLCPQDKVLAFGPPFPVLPGIGLVDRRPQQSTNRETGSVFR